MTFSFVVFNVFLGIQAAISRTLQQIGKDPKDKDPKAREEARIRAGLVPLGELYIVAALRIDVDGTEGWFPKLERRRNLGLLDLAELEQVDTKKIASDEQ